MKPRMALIEGTGETLIDYDVCTEGTEEYHERP